MDTIIKEDRLPLVNVLKSLRACGPAVDWSESYGSDYEKAWKECERGDFLVWILAKLAGDDPRSPERRKLSPVFVQNAMESHARLECKGFKVDERAKKALVTVAAWGRGDASVTLEDVCFVRDECWRVQSDAWRSRWAASPDAVRRGRAAS